MTCAEFQAVLPYIIDNGGNAEQQEHLRNCAVCSDLVNDLRYIAQQAKLLVPMMEPSTKVWNGIKTSLQREGLVKDSARGSLLGSTTLSRWGPAGWLLPVAAALLVAVGLFYYQNNMAGTANAPATQSASAETADSTAPVQFASMNNAQDQQVLSAISAHAPGLTQAYQLELQRVNAYIADARKLVLTNPDDEDSRQALLEAYQQKAMLYNMAMRHSLP
ncbi:MAG TPA: hypothetical protein VFU27_14160 [Terriglobales bacterium]|nr:hypothetical protein [Terriglobales bacterium]